MLTAVDLLGDFINSPDWSPRWMTVAEIAAELERLGFWEQPPFGDYADEARLDFVAGILDRPNADGEPAWARVGARFKPCALLTDEDHGLIQDWLDERRAALDDDLCRILLGERPYAGMARRR